MNKIRNTGKNSMPLGFKSFHTKTLINIHFKQLKNLLNPVFMKCIYGHEIKNFGGPTVLLSRIVEMP